MKRFLALLLVFVCLCVSAVADTVSIDTDTASLEELLLLRDRLNARIQALTGEQRLNQGVYVVGKDIPAGEYRIVCTDDVESVFLYVYSESSNEWYHFDHFYAIGSFHGTNEIARIALDDGCKLDIQGAAVCLLACE